MKIEKFTRGCAKFDRKNLLEIILHDENKKRWRRKFKKAVRKNLFSFLYQTSICTSLGMLI
jgi:hypothetical protein